MGGSEQCWECVCGSDCAGSAVANCRKREVETKKV